MRRYNPSEIEPKWQKVWEDTKANEVVANESKVKTYVAGMFPYPSGAGMHAGHAFGYTIVDAIARFYRQHGQLTVVDGVGSLDDVFTRIVEAIQPGHDIG